MTARDHDANAPPSVTMRISAGPETEIAEPLNVSAWIRPAACARDLPGLIRSDPPPWAETPLLAWDDQRFERVKPFLKQKYWTDRGSVNVFRVIGTQHPAYQGLSWREFLQRGVRMRLNLALYQRNPGYYTETAPKRPAMYYLTLDGGLSYYVAEDGNHRTAIARFDCWYRQDLSLHGVTITDLRIEWELARWHEHLNAVLDACRQRNRRFARVRIEPVTERIAREDGAGWMLESYRPRLIVRGWQREPLEVADAAEAAALERAWQMVGGAGRLRQWWSGLRGWRDEA